MGSRLRQDADRLGFQTAQIQRVATRCDTGDVVKGIVLILQVMNNPALKVHANNKARGLGGGLEPGDGQEGQ